MAWVGSLINAGALCGALVGGFLMDRFGRKTVLIFLSVPFVIGWLLLILAVDPSKRSIIYTKFRRVLWSVAFYFQGMLYIGRFLGGLAGGTSSVVAPSYVGNIYMFSLYLLRWEAVLLIFDQYSRWNRNPIVARYPGLLFPTAGVSRHSHHQFVRLGFRLASDFGYLSCHSIDISHRHDFCSRIALLFDKKRYSFILTLFCKIIHLPF